MALRIEDYALIGDTETAALVGTNGSIDWLCAPRFDSPAFFAALLGTDANGHWQIAPAGEVRRVERRYRPGTLVLETDFETSDGLVRLVDCMPLGDGHNDVVRIVEGLRGRVAMQMQLSPRFDYGRLIPAIGRIDQGMFAVAGPDAVCLRTPVELGAEGGDGVGGVHGLGRRTRPVSPRLVSLARPASRADRPVQHGGADGIVVAGVVGPLHVRGPARRGRAEIADHAEGAHVRADGRDRRRARRRRCRRRSGESETGTTASAGCATARSRWRRWCRPATWRRPSPGATGSSGRSPATRASCSSCTASAASTG